MANSEFPGGATLGEPSDKTYVEDFESGRRFGAHEAHFMSDANGVQELVSDPQRWANHVFDYLKSVMIFSGAPRDAGQLFYQIGRVKALITSIVPNEKMAHEDIWSAIGLATYFSPAKIYRAACESEISYEESARYTYRALFESILKAAAALH